MKTFARIVVVSLALCSAGWAAGAETITFTRDHTLEQALRYESGADKVMTPKKAIRALFGKKTASANVAPSSYETEFQPIVDVTEDHTRIVASFAYKF